MQQSPRYSILLYSKYSKRCSELLNILTQNNIENIFLKLCIDNEAIRKRIKNNKSIEVNLLPCILNVYDTGVVEKFEDDYAFELVRPMIMEIQNFRTLQESQQPVQSQVNKNRSQIVESIVDEGNNEDIQEEEEEIPRPPPKKSKKKLSKIEEEEEHEVQTENDRYKNPPKKKMMISDEHNYVEDEELFKGEDPELRKEPSKTIRSNTQKTQGDQNSTLAKAKELAQMRDKLDEEINNPRDRPLTRTRN